MYAVIGATGKTGGAVLRSLRAAGQPVRAVVRDRDRAEALGETGAAIGVATIADAGALAQAFAEASAAYVMLPPSLGAADFLAEKDAEIAFSPDGQYLFLTVGDRQRMTPAQDPNQTLGKIVRLTLDGKPAPGNPMAGKTGASSVPLM